MTDIAKCRELAEQSRAKAATAETAAMRAVHERSAAVWEREAEAAERRKERNAGILATADE